MIDELKTALPAIADCVSGMKKAGKELKGPCPQCGGTDRFYIRPDNSFGCRGCNEKGGDVVEFHKWISGSTTQDLARQYLNNEKLPTARAIPANLAATYIYTDQAGQYLFQVHRYEEKGREKTFRQFVDVNGDLVTPTEAGVKFVPYNLPGIHNSDEVVIVEGEKDADRLISEGVPATTTPGGGKNFKAEYAVWFKDKHLVIIPDQDETGTTYKKNIKKHCLRVAASVKVVDLPRGKDVSEFLDMGGTLGQIVSMVDAAPLEMPEADPVRFSLAGCSLYGQSERLEKKMQDDIHVLGKIALMGELVMWYAPPNAGKTLLLLYLLTQSIKAGIIKGENVFYINADDSYKGFVHKNKIAERWGFHQIVPGQGPDRENTFQPEHLVKYLKSEVEAGTAQGRVIILDTAKKFVNMMSKEKTAQFFRESREFCMHGGTVILLAHVNKHRDEDKQVVYEGVGDSLSDSDCSYTLDILSETFDGTRVVKFTNQKFRGYVEMTASYSYDASPNMIYADRLESVRPVDPEELKAAEEQRKRDAELARDKMIVDAITEAIRNDINTKTAIIADAAGAIGVSKPKVNKVLLKYTGTDYVAGKLWFVEKGERRTIKYCLNYQYYQKVKNDEI